MSALASVAATTAPAITSAVQQLSSPVFLNPIESFIGSFNTNPYFIGLMMLMLNFGGRFLGMEISKSQEKFFQKGWVRKILIFIVFFIATRNIFVAGFLTIITYLFFGILLNENSSFYLGGKRKTTESFETAGAIGGLSVEEKEILNRLTEKQLRYSKEKESSAAAADKKILPVEQIYTQNLNFLNADTTTTTRSD